jgi:hypothetical protein
VDRHPQYRPPSLAAVELAQQREPARHAGGELRSKLADLVLEVLERQVLQLPID